MEKKILIISPTPSHPQTQGNRTRIYSLILNLKEMGHDVYFIHIKQEVGDEKSMQQCWGKNFFSITYKRPKTASKKPLKRLDQKIVRRLQSLVVSDPKFTYAIDDWYDDSVNETLIDLSRSINPEVVIVEYVFLSKALELFSKDVLKIIDTHDIFADRYKLYQKNNQGPRWYSTTKKEENKGLSRADIVIAIQQHEANVLAKRLKNTQVVTVGHLVPLHQSIKEKLYQKILFIASSNIINVYTLDHFVKNVFSQIRLKFSDAQLILAGDICNEVESFQGCIKLGRVESLKDAYNLADLAINPILFGTGLKIKNIEALGYSKPLVTTTIGAEGMESGASEAFLIADSPEDFVTHITEIFSDIELYKKLSNNAYNFAKEWNLNCLDILKKTIESKSNSIN